jgi:hypothetical protein
MKLALAIATLAACQSGQNQSGQGGQIAEGGSNARSAEVTRPGQPAPRAGAQGGSSSPAAVPADGGVVDANLDACRAAAARVPSLPVAQRTVALLEGCQPCGEWGPLLAWDIPTADGGPTRAAIERGMVACKAFCDSTAKQRFFAALESARGQDTRKPWRVLGELCKAEVSAVPDGRFMTAPYFALDRAARMVGDAALLAEIELPLPAVSISGIGVELPTSPMVVSEAGPATLTIDAAQFLLGSLPTAKLSPAGVQVAGDYPGAKIEPRALAAALARRELAGEPVALLTPRELPAERIYEAVAAAGGHELRLAVARLELRNWVIPATVPIALAAAPRRRAAAGLRFILDGTAVEAIKAAQAAPRARLAAAPVTIAIDPTATAASLANLLGALGYLDVKSVVLAKTAARPSRAKP